MEQEIHLDTVCHNVIAKLKMKTTKLKHAQNKPKRLLRSHDNIHPPLTRNCPNTLISQENSPLHQYLPAELRQYLLTTTRINIDDIQQLSIQPPQDSSLGIINIKRALWYYEKSLQSLSMAGLTKSAISRWTIDEEKVVEGTSKMEPEEAYTLYLAEKIEELCHIGMAGSNLLEESILIGAKDLMPRQPDDFYGFKRDRNF